MAGKFRSKKHEEEFIGIDDVFNALSENIKAFTLLKKQSETGKSYNYIVVMEMLISGYSAMVSWFGHPYYGKFSERAYTTMYKGCKDIFPNVISDLKSKNFVEVEQCPKTLLSHISAIELALKDFINKQRKSGRKIKKDIEKDLYDIKEWGSGFDKIKLPKIKKVAPKILADKIVGIPMTRPKLKVDNDGF